MNGESMLPKTRSCQARHEEINVGKDIIPDKDSQRVYNTQWLLGECEGET